MLNSCCPGQKPKSSVSQSPFGIVVELILSWPQQQVHVIELKAHLGKLVGGFNPSKKY
jgi:hypothetical protein